MQVTCKQKDLALGLQKVSRALPTATTLPVLTGILVETQEKGLTLTATDLAVTVKIRVPAEIKQEGKVLLPGKMATELIKRINTEDLIIESQGNGKGRILYNKNKVELNTLDPDTYPAAPQVAGVEFQVEAQKFREAVIEVSIAAAKDTASPSFNSVNLELKSSNITLAATDTHRLAIRTLPITYTGEEKNCLIPVKLINEVIRILEGTVKVTLNNNFISFLTEDTYIAVRLSDAKFPNYRAVILPTAETKIKIDKSIMRDALERASLFVVDEKRIPIVTLNVNGNLQIKTCGSQVGDIDEVLEADIEGKEVQVSCNANLLLDSLRYMGGEKVEIDLGDAKKPMKVIPDSNDSLHMILPVVVRN